jgi:uroporphyrinogen-III decarboxylase
MTAMILFQSQPQFANLPKSDEAQDEQIRSLRDSQQHDPDAWHDALEAITHSTVNHIRHIKDLGASGALVSIFNAESKFGSVADYQKFSRPYDKRVFDVLADTKLSILHLHYLERPYIDQFKDFNAPVIHYSVKTSGIPISEVRKQYSQPIAGGVDEIDFGKLTVDEMRQQWTAAWNEAGSKYIAAPGCSVPDKTAPKALSRFPQSFGI